MMQKIFCLLLLAMFALAACDPGKKLSPEEQGRLDRENERIIRQSGGG